MHVKLDGNWSSSKIGCRKHIQHLKYLQYIWFVIYEEMRELDCTNWYSSTDLNCSLFAIRSIRPKLVSSWLRIWCYDTISGFSFHVTCKQYQNLKTIEPKILSMIPRHWISYLRSVLPMITSWERLSTGTHWHVNKAYLKKSWRLARSGLCYLGRVLGWNIRRVSRLVLIG